MKKVLLMLLCAASFCFVGCSDDDDSKDMIEALTSCYGKTVDEATAVAAGLGYTDVSSASGSAYLCCIPSNSDDYIVVRFNSGIVSAMYRIYNVSGNKLSKECTNVVKMIGKSRKLNGKTYDFAGGECDNVTMAAFDSFLSAVSSVNSECSAEWAVSGQSSSDPEVVLKSGYDSDDDETTVLYGFTVLF